MVQIEAVVMGEHVLESGGQAALSPSRSEVCLSIMAHLSNEVIDRPRFEQANLRRDDNRCESQ